MSLRHAVLGLVAELPGCSGYDLLKQFDARLAGVWPATQSQVYAGLARLAADGFVECVAEGPRGRKEYAVTDAGMRELRRWITETRPRPARRDESLLRVFFLGRLEPGQAKAYLEDQARVAEQAMVELSALDETAGRGFWRMSIEYERRALAVRREWVEWALRQISDDLHGPGGSPTDKWLTSWPVRRG
jgi:DNA-binding PadR family transcriptional regulator